MTTILRPNFEDPLNTAQDLVDNNITMFGKPYNYHSYIFNESVDPALKELAKTYHTAEKWDEYSNENIIYHIHEKGTHALIYSYLQPDYLKFGKWWRSTEHIPGLNPYGGFLSRRNWYLDEVELTHLYNFFCCFISITLIFHF